MSYCEADYYTKKYSMAYEYFSLLLVKVEIKTHICQILTFFFSKLTKNFTNNLWDIKFNVF